MSIGHSMCRVASAFRSWPLALIAVAVAVSWAGVGCAAHAQAYPPPEPDVVRVDGWCMESDKETPDQVTITSIDLRNTAPDFFVFETTVRVTDNRTGDSLGEIVIHEQIPAGGSITHHTEFVVHTDNPDTIDLRVFSASMQLVPVPGSGMPTMPGIPGVGPQEMLLVGLLLVVLVTIAVAFFLGKPRR